MTVAPLQDHNQEMPAPQRCAVGFANSEFECDEIVQDLNNAGFPDSTITVLSGADGIRLFKRMMGGASWGETAEDVLRQGVMEMNHGHCALVVETHDRDEALAIANIAARHGGHSFSHFGLLMDEGLTP